ncbi:aspartate 1-decarboxylase [Moheibacter sediminis]|uniref:Aspartate 1-decarboxylase n=1 Tax=Moheibacter sediminis TaxID=1434700 RepID=A0A1W1Y986_9FLAO|nr:aspartate 1-decarboxylase [Moheibacter sediminis]SMC32722.1 L-aspartate 1-decarboxylase [Moheibacter sediminis]
MMIEIVRSKLHRIKVTGAELNYIGSITIDEDLIDAAKMIVGEKVQIVNIQNGERFETYIIEGKRGSGEITLNGPAARRVQVGDQIIVIAYGLVNIEQAKNYPPTIVFPNEETNLLN